MNTMRYLKDLKIINKRTQIETSIEERQEIEQLRKDYNKSFQKQKLKMQVNEHLQVEFISTDKNGLSQHTVINEFFLFPLKIIIKKREDHEVHCGFRLAAIKQIKKKKIEYITFDINFEILKNSDWTKSKLFHEIFQYDTFLNHYN